MGASTGSAGGLVTLPRPVSEPARPVGHVSAGPLRAQSTGVGEVDRVLGGGLVPGSVVLLAGEPGIGKSTLLLDLAARWAHVRSPVLYVTGEESASLVRLRAERIEALDPRLYLAAETELGAVLTHAAAVLGDGDATRSPGVGPGGDATGLLVLDSVQTVASADLDGAPGGVAQVREVAGTLIRLAKETGHVVILVGHVTKDGSVAGPRTLEHLVDVVLDVAGERTSSLRVLRALKNRYGPTDEIGCFDLSDTGVVEVPDPSGLFLSHHHAPVSGTCVSVAAEGTRPIVAELQALVAPAPAGSPPRRTSNGLDPGRVAMVLAVLHRRARLPLHLQEVFAATVGGVRVPEPGVDLAIALAVASAAADVALAPGTVAIGEIGLAGELRPVPGIGRRLAEAARLGFSTAYVPMGSRPLTAGWTASAPLQVHEFPDLVSALAGVGLTTPARRNRRIA
jgi:DNA repair protein RadA/Sms